MNRRQMNNTTRPTSRLNALPFLAIACAEQAVFFSFGSLEVTCRKSGTDKLATFDNPCHENALIKQSLLEYLCRPWLTITEDTLPMHRSYDPHDLSIR